MLFCRLKLPRVLQTLNQEHDNKMYVKQLSDLSLENPTCSGPSGQLVIQTTLIIYNLENVDVFGPCTFASIPFLFVSFSIPNFCI